MSEREADDRKNLLAINFSLAANVLLAVAKTSVGIVGRSPALLADGVNSTSDVVYLAIVRAFIGEAHKPPDREHPFGHRQLESIAALVIGAFVVTTGLMLFWQAVNTVFDLATGDGDFQGAEVVALWVALVTLVLKFGLYLFTAKIGRQTGSIAVLALMRDHRNDIFSIATAAVGIAFGRAGYPWVDPAAAAMVALVIVYTGVRILRDSSADLMDVLPDATVSDRIHELLERVPGILAVEDIHIHRIGLYLMVNVTIGIDGTLSVHEGDRIASRAEDVLREKIEYLRQVSIHYHPAQPQVGTASGTARS